VELGLGGVAAWWSCGGLGASDLPRITGFLGCWRTVRILGLRILGSEVAVTFVPHLRGGLYPQARLS
jgi:hypothetical protein